MSKDIADGVLVWETRGALSRGGVAFRSTIDGADDVEKVTSGYGADARFRRNHARRIIMTIAIDQLRSRTNKTGRRHVSGQASIGTTVEKRRTLGPQSGTPVAVCKINPR